MLCVYGARTSSIKSLIRAGSTHGEDEHAAANGGLRVSKMMNDFGMAGRDYAGRRSKATM